MEYHTSPETFPHWGPCSHTETVHLLHFNILRPYFLNEQDKTLLYVCLQLGLWFTCCEICLKYSLVFNRLLHGSLFCERDFFEISLISIISYEGYGYCGGLLSQYIGLVTLNSGNEPKYNTSFNFIVGIRTVCVICKLNALLLFSSAAIWAWKFTKKDFYPAFMHKPSSNKCC